MKLLIASLIFSFVFNALLLAQDGGRRVELPSFVITGEEKFDLPQAQKIPPPFMPVLPEDYLKPVYPPEQLETFLSSPPIDSSASLPVPGLSAPNRINIAAGSYSMPSIDYNGLFFVKDFALFTDAFLDYRQPHLPKSGRLSMSPGIKAKYKIFAEESFFHHNEIEARLSYEYSDYQLYAAPLPARRKVGNLEFGASIESPRENAWLYLIDAGMNAFSVMSSNASEFSWKLRGKTGYKSGNLEILPSLSLERIITKNNLNSVAREFLFRLTTPISFNLWESLIMSGGLELVGTSSVSAMIPFVSAGFQVSQGFTLFASYHPTVDMQSMLSASRKNRFFSFDSLRNYVYTKRNNIDIGMIYEHERKLDVSFALSQFSSPDFPHFEFDTLTAAFPVRTSEMQALTASLEVKIYPFSYGHFIGGLKFRSYKFPSGMQIPNEPSREGTIAYALNDFFNTSLRAGVRFSAGQFADSLNLRGIGSFTDVFLEGSYFYSGDFLITLTINNLLNQKNYLWQTYRETPFDFSAGVSYRW